MVIPYIIPHVFNICMRCQLTIGAFQNRGEKLVLNFLTGRTRVRSDVVKLFFFSNVPGPISILLTAVYCPKLQFVYLCSVLKYIISDSFFVLSSLDSIAKFA